LRIMMIHAENFWYEARIKTPIAVEISEGQEERSFEEALVVLYCTEAVDDKDPSQVAKLAAEEIRSYLSKIGRKRIVLFPFAFLVARKEKSTAQTAAGMEHLLREALSPLEADVVPFGWYKKFSITSMGHKYAVHSVRVIPDQVLGTT